MKYLGHVYGVFQVNKFQVFRYPDEFCKPMPSLVHSGETRDNLLKIEDDIHVGCSLN